MDNFNYNYKNIIIAFSIAIAAVIGLGKVYMDKCNTSYMAEQLVTAKVVGDSLRFTSLYMHSDAAIIREYNHLMNERQRRDAELRDMSNRAAKAWAK